MPIPSEMPGGPGPPCCQRAQKIRFAYLFLLAHKPPSPGMMAPRGKQRCCGKSAAPVPGKGEQSMRSLRNPGPAAPDRLRRRLGEAAASLARDLPKADLSSLSEYNRHYLGRKLAVLEDVLALYAGLLCLALSRADGDLSRACVTEYGGGLGIMSLLAARAGVGTVVVNDIYDVSVKDAESLAKALHLPASLYVCGTMEDVLAQTIGQGLHIDAVVSYDVIEHVYDVPALFHILASLPGPVAVAMASGANPYNPRIRRQIQRLHRRVEHRDRTPEPGHKERDALKSYRKARR